MSDQRGQETVPSAVVPPRPAAPPMPPGYQRSSPIANRGPEALQLLLIEDRAGADAVLRLLTRSELVNVAAAADMLRRMAMAVVVKTWPERG